MVEASDGIIFAPDMFEECKNDPEVVLSTIRQIKQMGKPVLLLCIMKESMES